LAATPFEFVLAVSGLWTIQQACFLYSNKVVAGNLPVTASKTGKNDTALIPVLNTFKITTFPHLQHRSIMT